MKEIQMYKYNGYSGETGFIHGRTYIVYEDEEIKVLTHAQTL